MREPTGVNQTITPGGQCKNPEVMMTLVYEDDVCDLWDRNTGKVQVLEKTKQLKKIEKVSERG